MEDIGLHDTLVIDNRTFDIHTGIFSSNKKIICEVFEKGMFLTSKELPFDLRNDSKRINYEFLNRVTKSFHNSVIDEIEALYLIEEKLEKYKHPISHFHLASLFLKRNLYNEAIRQFNKTVKMDPDNLQVQMGLGIAYLKSKDFNKALEILEKTAEQEEKYPDILNYLGLTHMFLGNYDRATTRFKEAVEINSNYYECQFNLGVALYKSALDGVKDPKAVAIPARVVIYLKQVKELDRYQDINWQKKFNQLIELLKDNNHELIIPEIENFQLKLVDFSPGKDKKYEFYLRFLFGGDELSLDTIENYAPYFKGQEEKLSKYPDYWNDFGIFNLIKSRGYYLRAITEFEKAMELAPNFSEARKYRDMVKSNEKGFLILLRAVLK